MEVIPWFSREVPAFAEKTGRKAYWHHAKMKNSRFLCKNALFQRTTPPHVILSAAKDLSKTHRFGKPDTVSINDRFFAFASA